jgi:hypothetical protein
VFYIHPWELDPAQPRLRLGTRLSRFRHYVNLKTTERKLERLLERLRFGPVTQVVGRASSPPRLALSPVGLTPLSSQTAL